MIWRAFRLGGVDAETALARESSTFWRNFADFTVTYYRGLLWKPTLLWGDGNTAPPSPRLAWDPA